MSAKIYLFAKNWILRRELVRDVTFSIISMSKEIVKLPILSNIAWFIKLRSNAKNVKMDTLCQKMRLSVIFKEQVLFMTW